jgi:phasin
MTEQTPAKVAADKARAAYRKTAEEFEQFTEQFTKDTQMPEAVRAFAEKNIAQSREIYERSKDALEAVLESWERTFDAAGQGAVALNRKVIDITQRNINSSFDFAKSLVGAKTLAEAMELHSSYWSKQLNTLRAQAEEMRALSTRVTSDVTEPAKAQMKRGVAEFERTH